MRVVVIMGGWSAEREVSLWTGEEVASALETRGHQVIRFDLTPATVRQLPGCDADVFFNALHGPGGEDGLVQGLLDAHGLAYTHSGLRASALAMDKPITKLIAAASGIKCPESRVIGRTVPKEHPLPIPYVAKPTNQGSTFGVRMILDDADPVCGGPEWTYDGEILVERFVPGLELSVGMVDGRALDIIEIVPAATYYNFESKYALGGSRHILPARLPADVREVALENSERLWQAIDCRDVARVDYRYDPSEGGSSGLYMLEINTHPGMTRTSLLPEIAAHHGISFPDLVVGMVVKAAVRGPYRFSDQATRQPLPEGKPGPSATRLPIDPVCAIPREGAV